MRFVIHCLDHDDAVERRLAHYEAHKTYLAAAGPVRTVISGPLLAADHATMIGSLFVFEADTIDAVRAFNAADPFTAAKVWRQVSIHPFHLRVDNRPGDDANADHA